MNNKVQVPCDSIQCEETQVHFHLLTQADANPAGSLDRVMLVKSSLSEYLSMENKRDEILTVSLEGHKVEVMWCGVCFARE